jgi:Tol biopolymer transport system component
MPDGPSAYDGPSANDGPSAYDGSSYDGSSGADGSSSALDGGDEAGQGPISTLTGRIIYHSYSSYTAWDGQLYLLSLGDKSLRCLSCGWNIDNAINADFSPDGSMITFMGSIHGLKTWDVWSYKFGGGAPTNLTHQRMLINEDPKFAPSGTKIVFKESHWDNSVNNFVHQLKEMDLTGNVINTVTDGSVETSMPCYTTDGTKIVYAAGAGASSTIHLINVDGSGDTALLALSGIQEYYPIVRDGTSFLFTRWVSASDVNDQVYLSDFTGKATLLPFDEPNDNYSDAFPVGQRYVAMSSTRPGGKGGYDVYVADITSGDVTSLDQINPSANTANDELGSTYSPH